MYNAIHYCVRLSLLALVLCTSSAFAEGITVKPQPNIYDDVYIVSATDIKDWLTQQLIGKGVDANAEVSVKEFEKGIRVSTSASEYFVDVADLSLNQQTRRFKARLSFAAANNPPEFVTLEGKYEEYISVPVLGTSVSAGTAIDAGNIQWIKLSKQMIKQDTILDEDALAGQSAKRTLTAMRPIRLQDISQPQMIARNDVVDMVFSTSTLEVKTVGIAMEDGSKGQVIRVKNVASNKIVQAIVRGERTVTAIVNSNES